MYFLFLCYVFLLLPVLRTAAWAVLLVLLYCFRHSAVGRLMRYIGAKRVRGGLVVCRFVSFCVRRHYVPIPLGGSIQSLFTLASPDQSLTSVYHSTAVESIWNLKRLMFAGYHLLNGVTAFWNARCSAAFSSRVSFFRGLFRFCRGVQPLLLMSGSQLMPGFFRWDGGISLLQALCTEENEVCVWRRGLLMLFWNIQGSILFHFEHFLQFSPAREGGGYRVLHVSCVFFFFWELFHFWHFLCFLLTIGGLSVLYVSCGRFL